VRIREPLEMMQNTQLTKLVKMAQPEQLVKSIEKASYMKTVVR
jgi:hypothetical protein